MQTLQRTSLLIVRGLAGCDRLRDPQCDDHRSRRPGHHHGGDDRCGHPGDTGGSRPAGQRPTPICEAVDRRLRDAHPRREPVADQRRARRTRPRPRVPTPLVIASPTSIMPMISVSVPTNCRSGPGKAYPIEGALLVGEVAQVLGDDPTGNYWYIPNPDAHRATTAGCGASTPRSADYRGTCRCLRLRRRRLPTLTPTPSPGFGVSL